MGFNPKKMRKKFEGVQCLLKEIGFSENRSQEISNLLNQSSQSQSYIKNEKSCKTKLLLRILTEIIIDLKNFENDVPILISYIDTNEDKLDLLGRGILKHIKAIIAWKLDNDQYFPMLYLNDSIKLLSKDTSDEANVYMSRVFDTYGQLLVSQGYLNDAKTEFYKALKTKSLVGDDEGLAITNGNIGRLYMQLGDYERAIHFLMEDYKIIHRLEPENIVVMAQLLSTISRCQIKMKAFYQAKIENEKSFELNKKLKNATGLAFNYLNYAEINLSLNMLDKAKQDILRAEDILKSKKVVRFLSENIRGKILELNARILYLDRKYDLSFRMFEKALNIFHSEISITNIENAHLLRNFADLANSFGDEEKAGQLYRRALRYLDASEDAIFRAEIEEELKKNHNDSWMLHSAGRYIGHEQIEFLLSQAGKGSFVGEEKEVIVLFSDIRGFTLLSEKLDPKKLIEVLNNFLTKMTKAIELYDGFIDKFIGDAVMAVFGLPVSKTGGPNNDAERAVRAALLMKEELRRLNMNLSNDLPELKIGIGLHAGRATVGLIGSPQKRSYTLIGDVVNTASRIEGMTKLLGVDILASDDLILKLERSDIIVNPMGKYCPKGRKQFVEVSSISGIDDGGQEMNRAKKQGSEVKALLRQFMHRNFLKVIETIENIHLKDDLKENQKVLEILKSAAREYLINPPSDNWKGEIMLSEK